MKAARESSETLHVLRVASLPSEQLQSSLEPFIKPGLLRPRFSIKTLSGIALDAANHRNHDAIRNATEAFEGAHQPLQLSRTLAARRMGDGALKILMASQRHSETINLLKGVRKDYFPDEIIVEDDEDIRFDLYVRIDGSRAISQGELKGPGLALREQLSGESNYLFNITPTSIVGLNEMRTIKRVVSTKDTA